MRPTEPSVIIELFRPLCSSSHVTRAREPSDDPYHDLRTFECMVCSNADTVTVKFR